ncbi:MAG: transporter substrate-binding domain-containing protein [Clostridia bacterium]|nr:transporter substrate-binding domain-containing protein [Clostridia bacterium]
MKKILALALAVLMVATMCVAFASCGKNSDWKKIEKNGKFVCGITIYAPMNYYDANGDLVEDADGTLIGFDTELAKLVAQKLGVEVEFQIIDWGNKYTELQGGAIDCIWNGFTSNSKDADGIERSEKVDFTHAYLDNKQCVIVKTDRLGEFTSAAALSGKKAGAESGSAGESYALSAGATIDAAKSSQLAVFTDLKSNAVDFIVVDRLLADAVVGKNDYADLSIVTAIDIDPEVYSIGCRKGSDFDEKINEALVELLNEGKVEELATKYNVRITDSFMAKKTAK